MSNIPKMGHLPTPVNVWIHYHVEIISFLRSSATFLRKRPAAQSQPSSAVSEGGFEEFISHEDDMVE